MPIFLNSVFFVFILMMAVGAPEGSSHGRFPEGVEAVMALTPTPASAFQEKIRPEDWTEDTHGDVDNANFDVVFKEGVVHRLDVTIASLDWQAMLDDMTSRYGEFGQASRSRERGAGDHTGVNPMWVPCTVNYNGHQWLHVGIRFKGNSSLKSTWRNGIYKLPLRLDFDQFENSYPEIYDQRFYGFQKLSLSSGWKDASLMREKITADIFREAGVPAPRTAFYRVYVEHGDGPVYFGLYTLVEIPSTPMFRTQFSGAGGNLYKPEKENATFSVYNETSFGKATNEGEADFSDVRSLYEALHADRTDAEAWRRGLEATLNVPEFVRWLAVNTVIQNWDTYGVMSHNYYLYNDPETGLLNWIPWDNNEALALKRRRPLSLALTEVTSRWPLIRYLMDDSVYYDMYVSDVLETVTNVFYPDRMQTIYSATHELIRPYVVGAEGEIPGYTLLSSPEAFDTAFEYLNTQVKERHDDAMAFVSGHEK